MVGGIQVHMVVVVVVAVGIQVLVVVATAAAAGDSARDEAARHEAHQGRRAKGAVCGRAGVVQQAQLAVHVRGHERV